MFTKSKPGAIVTCLYPRIPDFKFNMDYYLSSHIPLTTKLWAPHGLLHATVCELVSDADDAIKVVLDFKELESWDAAMKDEESQKLVDDVKNFTNATPKFLVGKVVS